MKSEVGQPEASRAPSSGAGTLQDVARRVGESINTVSRILSDVGKFNRPTMQRKAAKVRQIAAELNDRPTPRRARCGVKPSRRSSSPS